ncbi:hypothetical protein U1701_07370 [Sphingomonas sp. PB2P19]|uniref:hypothetical protein n=1 Tax=Sphingomonas rhamnosi TaxID=3096156 RepID=UPI002FC78095
MSDRLESDRAAQPASTDERVDHRFGGHGIFNLLGPRNGRRIGKIEDGEDRVAREGDPTGAVPPDNCDCLRQLIFVHERIVRGDPLPTPLLREFFLAIDRHGELHVPGHVEPAVYGVDFGRLRGVDSRGVRVLQLAPRRREKPCLLHKLAAGIC